MDNFEASFPYKPTAGDTANQSISHDPEAQKLEKPKMQARKLSNELQERIDELFKWDAFFEKLFGLLFFENPAFSASRAVEA